MDKRVAYRIVFNELIKNPLFTGIYDAENGSKEFMHGVATVMENIAYNISPDMCHSFSAGFCNNMYDCIKEAEK